MRGPLANASLVLVVERVFAVTPIANIHQRNRQVSLSC